MEVGLVLARIGGYPVVLKPYPYAVYKLEVFPAGVLGKEPHYHALVLEGAGRLVLYDGARRHLAEELVNARILFCEHLKRLHYGVHAVEARLKLREYEAAG